MRKHMHSLQEWQKIKDAYTGTNTNECPAVFRIDNTIFSTAKFYGGFTYSGHNYRVEYYDDGALLAVRDDFEKWSKKFWRKYMKDKEVKP